MKAFSVHRYPSSLDIIKNTISSDRSHYSSNCIPRYLPTERLESVHSLRKSDGSWCMSCRMVLEDRTEIQVGDWLGGRMRNRVLTRILRFLHVVQPLDFPGTPTMTKGISSFYLMSKEI